MKKVLILSAGYGEGHNTAARNVRMALDSVGSGEVEAKVLDLLEITYGRVNELLKKAYLATINRAPLVWEKIYGMIDSSAAFDDLLASFSPLRHAMEALLEEEKPDAVVCTFPVYNCLIDQVYGDRSRPFSLMTVITDSITINAVWYRCGSDAFIVPNEETAAELRHAGVSSEKIHVLGFPVSPRYAEFARGKKKPARDGARWQVLYMAGSGRKEAMRTARALTTLGDIDLRITAGRDKDWQVQIQAAVGGEYPNGTRVEVLGWTDKMPELMAGAHLLIGKAGGATVQESLAAGTPMVMTKVVPGQEEGNARLLLENGCGILARTPEEIIAAVESSFAGGGVLWLKWRANGERLSRPDAARAIARFIIRHCSS